jgi:hypothetical protein
VEIANINGLTLYFDLEEQTTADLIASACEKSIRVIRGSWGLEPPSDCRVYVMTSWPRFLFHSAPWSWRILLVASVPLWVFRVRKLWDHAGGWAQRYGQRRVVGVKPPRLIAASERSIGQQIFVQADDLRMKVEQVTCHELTHAFAAHLRLPMWLNEGMAMVTVDRYCREETVQRRTLETLARRHPTEAVGPGSYRDLRMGDHGRLVYHCVRGYWLTRYIEDIAPGLIAGGLAQGLAARQLEDAVIAACGLEAHLFWSEIDGLLVSHFGEPASP